MKKALSLSTALILCAAASGAATLGLDSYVGQATLSNSGDATEIAAMESALGLGAGSLSIESKVQFSDLTFGTDDAGNYFADMSSEEPGYFILKFGGYKKIAGASSHYFFKNGSEMNYLVWSSSQVNGLMDKCSADDCKLSHVTTFAGSVPSVPLPASGLLLLAGVFGVAGAGRRKKS